MQNIKDIERNPLLSVHYQHSCEYSQSFYWSCLMENGVSVFLSLMKKYFFSEKSDCKNITTTKEAYAGINIVEIFTKNSQNIMNMFISLPDFIYPLFSLCVVSCFNLPPVMLVCLCAGVCSGGGGGHGAHEPR